MQPRLVRRFWKGRYNFHMTKADHISLVIVIILGLIISSTTAYLVSQSQQQTRQLELENLAYIYLSQANSTLNYNISMLYNIRGVFNASSSVDADEFKIFTDPILEGHTEIQALEWIPKIALESRSAHEKMARHIGHEDYEIKEKSDSGEMVRAGKRQTYYPVLYANPVTGNEKALGFDLASNTSRKIAMSQAIETGKPVATSPIRLVQDEGEQLGFLIFLAVYDESDEIVTVEQRHQKILGFVLAVYRINDLFKRSAELIKDPDLSVKINDISSIDSPIYLFSSLSKKSHNVSAGKYRGENIKKVQSYKKIIKLAGRTWLFDFYHVNDRESAFNFASILVFSFGFIFTAFIAAYVLGNSRRRSIVEELIADRTQELENIKNKTQQVLDNTGEGICGIDVHGHTTFVNHAALEITGYNEDEFLYSHQHKLIHHHYPDGSEYPEEKCAISSVFKTGEKTTVDDEVFWHKDGTAIPVEYTTTPMLDEGGVIRGAVVIFRDIAERKKYEAEIITARNNAEQASQAKSTFLATMSHEIRTPMNGMLGMAQLLAETKLNDVQNDYVETLIQSGHSLLNQINDILDFSRIEAGRLEIEVHAFDLEKCCLELIQLMKNRAEEKGLEIQLRYPHDCPKYVIGDNHRIQQILLNLIGNAIKFTAKGHVLLNIEHKVNADSQGEYHAENSSYCSAEYTDFSLQVIDTGIGIDENKQASLFDSFTQADASTTRMYGGSGLGLAISKQLASLMDGNILVESSPGKGSTFSLLLNLIVTRKDALKESLDIAEQLFFTGHVLLVEDNHVNQKVASAMLKNMGLEVSLADNGERAVDEFRKNDFDLILMDCQMPVMDGYNATQQIRLFDKGKSIPILALTANVLPEDIQRCTDAGMNDCLHKPVEIPVLQQALKQWLKYKSQPVHVESAADKAELSQLNAEIISVNDTDISAGIDIASYVNTEHLNSLASIMGDVFNELIPAYTEATDEFFSTIKESINNNDLQTAERLAHSLKSSSRNVGAEQLGELAETLEGFLREKNTDNFDSIYNNAEQVYHHVRQILMDFKPNC